MHSVDASFYHQSTLIQRRKLMRSGYIRREADE
jgi:hypothetical protein